MAMAMDYVDGEELFPVRYEGQPTVPANTTEAADKKLSYSDKSNTSPGTNAKMKKKHMAAADKSSPELAQESTTSNVEGAHDEDNKDIDRKNDLALSEPAANGNGGASNPDAASNPPLSATKAEEAGSTTGKSAGR